MTLRSNKPGVPFWESANISAAYDIAILRPPTLSKSDQFETLIDACEQASRANEVLQRSRTSTFRHQVAVIEDCAAGHYHCELTICPRCARAFRRWFISEALKIASTVEQAEIVTIYLASAAEGGLVSLDIKREQMRLRKRLQRLGCTGAILIGGTEVNYQARHSRWVLHMHLLAVDVPSEVWSNLRENSARGQVTPSSSIR